MSPRRGDLFWVESEEDRGSVPPIEYPHVIVQADVFNVSGVDAGYRLSPRARVETEVGRGPRPGRLGNVKR